LQKATPRKERQLKASGAHKVVVTSEHGYVIVGIDTRDRPGLLLDISKGLLRLNLTLRHSEASVVKDRSISIWRCEVIGANLPDLEEIWSVMNVLLESTNQEDTQGLKREGVRVIRAVVTPTSTLVGKASSDVKFKEHYKAAIIAVQKGGGSAPLSGYIFGAGDILILQTNNESPLLRQPPADFYKRGADSGGHSRNNSVNSFLKKISKSLSGANLVESSGGSSADIDASFKAKPKSTHSLDEEGGVFVGDATGSSGNAEGGPEEEVQIEEFILNVTENNATTTDEKIWRDLQVVFPSKEKRNQDGTVSREFLTAMKVAPKSQLAGRTTAETGLDKLPGVFLVSIDRPTGEDGPLSPRNHSLRVMRSIHSVTSDGQSMNHDKDDELASLRTVDPVFKTVSPDTPLEVGDVLWFAGGAQSVGDLRKVPGLVSFESEEVEKINEKVHDRRLVEAVIARRGPLVGKTVKQVRFRTKYGAAVIAVHRDGAKVHEHPGRIKLQGGDVLLLEAGPTFIKGSADSDRAFTLLAEVEDSAPPRLRLLIPALLITVAMLAV
jgi:K+/H+ antiporter YhaU regulatory subunit KhtT